MRRFHAVLAALIVAVVAPAFAQSPFNRDVKPADSPQWGRTPHRNNVAPEVRLPAEWNPNTGPKIKWSMPLGSFTYGNVVVANGKVYVGTNNGGMYLERYPNTIDLSVLLCFRESDGKFLWQHSVDKLPRGVMHDRSMEGNHSSPVVEGDRLWYVTTRGEVVCLDTEGFYDEENDGPLIDSWMWQFAIIHDLKQFAKELPSGRADVNFQHTLRPFAAQAGLPHPSWWRFAVEPAKKPNVWYVCDEEQDVLTRRYVVTLDDDLLKIDGLGDLQQKHLEIGVNLLDGLDEGRISSGLQAQFETRKIQFQGEPKPKVIEPQKSWTVEAVVQNQPVELRLEVAAYVLTCHLKTTPEREAEADVVWSFDMMGELGVRQHDRATCSPTIWGDLLFICTSNGIDASHLRVTDPHAPSFMAMNKHTGKVVWTTSMPGTKILHGQWASPAVGVFDGVAQVIFGGGDGWVYGFKADEGKDGKPILLWKFDANLKEAVFVLGGRATRCGIVANPVIYEGHVFAAIGEDPEHGEGPGHLWQIDPTKRGDVSPEIVVDENGDIIPPWQLPLKVPLARKGWKTIPNPNSAAVWHYDQHDQNGDGKFDHEEIMHRTVGSPVIKDGILVITDFSGLVHCLDAKTGKPHWTHDTFDAVWTTPLIAGDRILVTDEAGDVLVFPLSADPQQALPPKEFNMGEAFYTMPVVANDVLYLATKCRLFAVGEK